MSLSRTARIAIATIGLVLSSLPISVQPVAAQDQPPPDKALSAGEIEALVAPIALYPDQLLAKVLIASTYPLEVVEADRWAQSNANLKGSALDSAAAKQSWDDNVKSLTATPAVLKMMSDRLDWTQKLGDTFLSQEKDVTDAVQRLRRKAQEHGTLKTTAQQTVTTQNVSDYQVSGGGGGGGEVQYQGEQSGSGQSQVIVIEPTEPNTVYVPYYDTQTAYGGWPYPSYPPYSYPPPYGYGWAAAGLGFLAGAAIAGGWWNCGVGWGNGGVYINHNNFNNFNRNNINNINRNNIRNGQRWNHQVNHRKGVGYGNNGLRDKYGRNSGRGANGRQDFRGRGDANRVANNLGGNRGGIGGRDGIGNNRNGIGNNRGGIGNNGVGGRNGLGNNGVGNRNGVGNNRGNFGNNRMASNPSRGGGFGNNSSFGNRGGSSYGNRGGGLDRSSYGSGGRGGGFDGVGRGSSTRQFSSRGSSSMRSSGGGFRSSGGGMRGGGGGRGGGGRRR